MMKEADIFFMRRALVLAKKAAYSARPNPNVGCVLVRDDAIIGEGFTSPPGGNHAEIQALIAAGDASNATAYVTLEPCSHSGLTGPCSEALIKAGISRIFIALKDPNPVVAGKGLARLVSAGVEVNTGLLCDEAEASITGFVKRMRRGRGRVRAKLAMSLDGRTAMRSGESKWITGQASRKDVQVLRAESCAILTGIGTVIADDCRLTVREADLRQLDGANAMELRAPLRVVLDSKLRIPRSAKILSADASTLVVHGHGAELNPSLPNHVENQAIGYTESGLDLHELMDILNERCCNEILVESGSFLAGSLLREGLLDELIIYVSPMFLGSDAAPLIDLQLKKMSDRISLEIIEHIRLEDDFRLKVIPNTLSGD